MDDVTQNLFSLFCSFIHSFIHSLFAIYTKFYNARLEYEIKKTVNGEET